jgi:hypothetical protein
MPEEFRGVHAASIPRTKLSMPYIGYADFGGNSRKLLLGIPAISPVILTAEHSE